MNPLQLAIRSLFYFRRKNLALAMGVAITTAVITGSLVVGDSVDHSLHQIASKRLGSITHVVDCGDRFVTGDLATSVAGELGVDVSAILMTDGMAVSGGGSRRMNGISVIGVDSEFDLIGNTGRFYASLSGDSVIISENLSERLQVSRGDEFLLRMEKSSLAPANAPFVSDAENLSSLRVVVKDIAGEDQMGAFHLKTSQTAPFNLFISGDRLRSVMEMEGYVNFLLFSEGHDPDRELISAALGKHWQMKDAGLEMEVVPGTGEIQVSTSRVFIDSVTSRVLSDAGNDARPIITYFVNALATDARTTPYSFVSTFHEKAYQRGEMVINSWLADDLGVSPGDTLIMTYFVIGPLRELDVDSVSLVIADVIPIGQQGPDRLLMPEIPGLSDAGNCRDWETGVPIELEAIRDKDEDYWTRWKGTPKAYVHPSLAADLWSNRFGNATAFRYPGSEQTEEELSAEILNMLQPSDIGINVLPVREQAAYAARNGIDFAELFLGLSFFLIAGGMVLTILLFRLNIDERKEQVKTLNATGVPGRIIRRILLAEWFIVGATGGLAGLLLAVGYNELVFKALNSVWSDIVRSDMMVVKVEVLTLLAGFLASFAVSLIAILLPLNRFLKSMQRRHMTGPGKGLSTRRRKLVLAAGILLFIAAVGIVVVQLVSGKLNESGLFFAAGGCLLISGILIMVAMIHSARGTSSGMLSFTRLSYRNAIRNGTRSIGITVMFAIGTFLVISTGANRKDLFQDAGNVSSGTGGFLYYAESTVAVLRDLNSDEARYDFSLGEGYTFTQFRLAEGDDASCLNLNRIEQPAILGVDPGLLSGRFSFVTATDLLDSRDPWMTLAMELSDGVVPAIADETVIKWGLGKEVGDTLTYTNAAGEDMKLLLVGGLAPSIFQGRVIISESAFLENYPSGSGSNVFLVDGPLEDTARIAEEIELGMRDLGWSMTYAPERLAEFNSVTNTYLSIFLVLGAIGLMLGTIGLSVILYRSVLERREEIAMLKAVGYRLQQVRGLLIREYTGLLLIGTGIGFLSAMIATMPSVLSENTDISIQTILIVIVAMLLNGSFWTWILARRAIRRRSIFESLRNE